MGGIYERGNILVKGGSIFTCLPNGLASAPRIFTNLLKPVYATLRSMGHLNSGHIDDSYLQGDTSGECHKNVIDTAMLFTKLGFHIHPEKSIFVPTQQLIFLGFVLDSIAMTVTLTEEKIQKIVAGQPVCRVLTKQAHGFVWWYFCCSNKGH